jgi:Ethanolamine utilization protein EutJ (predicted chaperonin)
MERVIERETEIPGLFKPAHPFLVTPLGIAMNCGSR